MEIILDCTCPSYQTPTCGSADMSWLTLFQKGRCGGCGGEGKETILYEAVAMFRHCAMQPNKAPLLQLWWGMFVLTTKHSLHRQCC